MGLRGSQGERVGMRGSRLSGGQTDSCSRSGIRAQRRSGALAMAPSRGGGLVYCAGGPGTPDRAEGRSTRDCHKPPGGDAGSAGTAPISLVVCFSGKIASGKTSTSRAVASALRCGRASFGDYLRDEVTERGGDPGCRKSLQDLGQGRLDHDAESFCTDVLAAGGFVPGEDFVLDGIRHVEVLPHLISISAPSEVRLIFLKADAGLRSIRVADRSGRVSEDFDRATNHLVEADMEAELPMAAHAIVDSSLPEQDVIKQCIELIDAWRWAGSCVESELEATDRMWRK